MVNKARDRESGIEQDEVARLADVIGMLVRDGVLQWSSLGGKPVTVRGKPVTENGKPAHCTLEAEIEEWLRHG